MVLLPVQRMLRESTSTLFAIVLRIQERHFGRAAAANPVDEARPTQRDSTHPTSEQPWSTDRHTIFHAVARKKPIAIQSSMQ